MKRLILVAAYTCFGCLVLADVAFVAEHIWLVTRPSPPTIDGPTCIVKLVRS